MVLTRGKPLNGLPEAEGIIGDGENSDHGHPGFHPLLQTMVLKVIEVQFLQCLQCHLDWTTQTGPDILDGEGDTEKKHV